jgi:hypothetical protein
VCQVGKHLPSKNETLSSKLTNTKNYTWQACIKCTCKWGSLEYFNNCTLCALINSSLYIQVNHFGASTLRESIWYLSFCVWLISFNGL